MEIRNFPIPPDAQTSSHLPMGVVRFVLLVVDFLRQDLTVYAWMTWNSYVAQAGLKLAVIFLICLLSTRLTDV